MVHSFDVMNFGHAGASSRQMDSVQENEGGGFPAVTITPQFSVIAS
jgi:hypothetical protein